MGKTVFKGEIDMRYVRMCICFLMIFSLLCCGVSANDTVVKVYVNGMRVNRDGFLADSSTYVPLRAIGEALGATVAWDGTTNSAFITFTEDDAIAQLVENASPSVVTIIGNYAGTGATDKYNNPTMHGSGVVYKSNGYIITNAHVVKDIRNLTVVLNDGTSVPGKVLYSDEDADLAVVKIEKLGLRPISMADPSTILSGKTAIAVGTPISLSMRNSVTKGIVSGCDVALKGSYYKLIQTDAAINPGNSGGPLLNSKGELIGINSSKFVNESIDNMGFAIPVDTVQYVIGQFEKFGSVQRPVIDFELEESWEAKIGLPTTKGITVKNSKNPQLLDGDTINSVNGISVHSIADWNEAIKDTYDGTGMGINYTRAGVSAYIKI